MGGRPHRVLFLAHRRQEVFDAGFQHVYEPQPDGHTNRVKAFKASVIKSIHINEHGFAVEAEIAARWPGFAVGSSKSALPISVARTRKEKRSAGVTVFGRCA